MSPNLKERLEAVLITLSPHEQQEVLDFAEFLAQRHGASSFPPDQLSEEEHARIIAVLDSVAALSQESGPPVSNRDHDTHLYRGY